jgi:3-methyladenine DNA glycosylase AlkD
MSISPDQYTALIRTAFRDKGKPETARGQMAYMKDHFPFFGLKKPEWTGLTKAHFEQYGVPSGADLDAVIRKCYQDEYREMHYFALEAAQKNIKKQPAEWISLLEELIGTNSWWDSVDWIAKLVGIHFQRFPELIEPVTSRWMASCNFWLQRVCLIFQLSYRNKTDAALLFKYVQMVAASKEFFLQKGAGWALRQYSRTDPEAVRAFVERTSLAPLTRREALRLMDKP